MRSCIACIVKGYHSFTGTPCVSSTSGMNHTCLCLPSRSWYSFIDPGGMEGSVDMVRSSLGRDSNLQPPDYKSDTLPHSQYRNSHVSHDLEVILRCYTGITTTVNRVLRLLISQHRFNDVNKRSTSTGSDGHGRMQATSMGKTRACSGIQRQA